MDLDDVFVFPYGQPIENDEPNGENIEPSGEPSGEANGEEEDEGKDDRPNRFEWNLKNVEGLLKELQTGDKEVTEDAPWDLIRHGGRLEGRY